MREELVEVFLVFCIVDLWVYPVVTHLPFVSKGHLVELLGEEMV